MAGKWLANGWQMDGKWRKSIHNDRLHLGDVIDTHAK
jgi:hypothetical protein